MTSDAPPGYGARGYSAPGYGAPGYGAPAEEAPAAHHGGFLTTLPGILTAVAAVITALSGGLGIYLAQGSGNTSGGLGQDAAPAPVGTVQADPDRVAGQLGGVSVGDEIDALVGDCAAGSVDACTALMDRLVDECHLGDPLSCDALYWLSPFGSVYEDYGATCGGRYDWTYAGACSGS
ncbi:hypothetical protein [Blastococcus sp. VKM Ac-2987]|uniref:hypothetical protein n=1 Tax=Blastococcus sp. VKM Ac-2987 TaxID=3004141 RepID=UPI0022AB90EF|nr:hypothetical protein [Blastococcus sp. VKM Ac-2987]MCZ2860685.1 hypothetical protein [Blastococcus sp. VKM Ac-2987]